MKEEKDAREGEWDFDGACAPPENGSGGRWGSQLTFTLGCFQWVRRGRFRRRGRLKKGRVRHRVKGDVYSPREAYRVAREFCAEKNAAK